MNKQKYLEMGLSLKVGCLSYAVGKQLSLPYRYQRIIVDSGKVDAYIYACLVAKGVKGQERNVKMMIRNLFKTALFYDSFSSHLSLYITPNYQSTYA